MAESGEPERLRAFQVSPNYFQLVGASAQLGRTLIPGDDWPERKHVVILSQSLWQRRFGLDPSVIGRAIRLDGEKAQHPDANLSLVARTSMNPKVLIAPLRQAIWAVDKNQPIDNPRTMTQVVTTSNGGNRLIVFLLEIFAILALLLVAIGIYGVIAFMVSQRTREIGIRLALGARRQAIIRMVLKNGIKLAAIGLLVGLPLSAPIPHLLQRVFQVHMVIHTAAVLIGVPAFVTLIALASTYVPALRASRVDPMHALRYE